MVFTGNILRHLLRKQVDRFWSLLLLINSIYRQLQKFTLFKCKHTYSPKWYFIMLSCRVMFAMHISDKIKLMTTILTVFCNKAYIGLHIIIYICSLRRYMFLIVSYITDLSILHHIVTFNTVLMSTCNRQVSNSLHVQMKSIYNI